MKKGSIRWNTQKSQNFKRSQAWRFPARKVSKVQGSKPPSTKARAEGSKISEFQEVRRFQSCRVPRLQGSAVPGFQDPRDQGFQCFKEFGPGLQAFKFSRLQRSKFRGFQGARFSSFSKFKAPRLQGMKFPFGSGFWTQQKPAHHSET